MKAAKQLTALILGACGIVSAQVASRADLIDSARTQKETNLTPETPPQLETRIESIEHSQPYRLLTGGDGWVWSRIWQYRAGRRPGCRTTIHPSRTVEGPPRCDRAGARFHQRIIPGQYERLAYASPRRPRLSGFRHGPQEHSRDAVLWPGAGIAERQGAATTAWKIRIWNCVPRSGSTMVCAPVSSAPTSRTT